MRHLLLLSPLWSLSACDGGADDTGKNVTESDADTDADTDTDTDTDVDNHAPSTPVVTIEPLHPLDTDPLTLTYVQLAEDPDGDGITYRVEWARNGTVDGTLTGDTVPADATSEGDTWSVAVTPNDGTVDGSPATASVTVGNQPPSAPVIHLSPEAPMSHEAISLVVDTPSVDPEGDTITQTIQWYDDGIYVVSWDGDTAIAAAQVDGGETFRVVVTVTDGLHEPIVVEDSVTVGNQPPSLDSISITPGVPENDDDIQVRVRSSDPDGTTPDVHYTWFRDGTEAADVGDTDRVDSALTEPGQAWYVHVLVTDGHETVEGDSETVTVAGPTMMRYGHYFDAILTGGSTDGTWDDLVGTWDVLLQLEGAEYGHVDCHAYYDVRSTSVGRCRGCDFAFNVEILYDSASSTMNTPTVCAYMEADGTGFINVERSGYVEFQAYGPGLGWYSYGIPYSYGGYMYWYVYGNYEYSYPGYAVSMGAISEEDTAGNRHFQAWSYRYAYYR